MRDRGQRQGHWKAIDEVERARKKVDGLVRLFDDEIQQRLFSTEISRHHDLVQLRPLHDGVVQERADDPVLARAEYDDSRIEILPPRKRDIRKQLLKGADAGNDPGGAPASATALNPRA